MDSSTLPHASCDRGWRAAALWIGLATGPLVWAALLEANYVLSYVACETHRTWILHATTATALLLVTFGGLAVSRLWLQVLRGSHEHSEQASTLRVQAMAMGGVAMCLWFTLVILAMEIPVVVLSPCTP